MGFPEWLNVILKWIRCKWSLLHTTLWFCLDMAHMVDWALQTSILTCHPLVMGKHFFFASWKERKELKNPLLCTRKHRNLFLKWVMLECIRNGPLKLCTVFSLTFCPDWDYSVQVHRVLIDNGIMGRKKSWVWTVLILTMFLRAVLIGVYPHSIFSAFRINSECAEYVYLKIECRSRCMNSNPTAFGSGDLAFYLARYMTYYTLHTTSLFFL